MQPARDFGG